MIKAICLSIAGREAKAIKADSADCYQLTLSSKIDVQKVVCEAFFSSPDNHPLYGYKLEQYNIWLVALKSSSRYKNIKNLCVPPLAPILTPLPSAFFLRPGGVGKRKEAWSEWGR